MEMSVCACKGIRTCLICEQMKGVTGTKHYDSSSSSLNLCFRCGNLFMTDPNHGMPDDHVPMMSCSPFCSSVKSTLQAACVKDNLECLSGIIDSQFVSDFDGVLVVKDFVSEEEEMSIVHAIDCVGWAESQSGRKKQV